MIRFAIVLEALFDDLAEDFFETLVAFWDSVAGVTEAFIAGLATFIAGLATFIAGLANFVAGLAVFAAGFVDVLLAGLGLGLGLATALAGADDFETDLVDDLAIVIVPRFVRLCYSAWLHRRINVARFSV